MKIYILSAKITACAILITAIHTTFGADLDVKSPTRTQAVKDMLATKAAQAAQLAWQGSVATGRYFRPYAERSVQAAVPHVQRFAETAAPVLAQAAAGTRAVTQTLDPSGAVRAAARQGAGLVAAWQWPDMINNLANIQTTLYRLDATIKFLKTTFHNLVQVLPADQIEEIGRQAGLVTNVEYSRPR